MAAENNMCVSGQLTCTFLPDLPKNTYKISLLEKMNRFVYFFFFFFLAIARTFRKILDLNHTNYFEWPYGRGPIGSKLAWTSTCN